MHLKILVTAGARAEEVAQLGNGRFEVSVKEEAERNTANGRVLEIFRKLYPGKSVKIVSGHHKNAKIIEIG